jgi:putative flippase GtrA
VNRIGVQILRFFAVGGGATLVHVAAALVFNAALGIRPLVANFLAFLVAWGLSYWGNWRWTFRAESAHGRAMPRFFAVSLALFFVNQAIVYVAVERLGWPFWAALSVVVAVVPAAGFAASRLWAFLPSRDRTNPSLS